ncbi:hypothetical protein N7512_003305 [Penicillium capsulatum]|nr:hypothetical protein N7512_003305 [Penicillium capsulatum]
MKIADIGAGTGLWTLEVAHGFSDAQVMAYDIADTYFPAKEYWPSNLTFDHLDCLNEPPASLAGQFDVVHLRMWAIIIKENDPCPLIRHASKLLKPGGFIQWEDARFGSSVMRGEAAIKIQDLMGRFSASINQDYKGIRLRWLDELDQHVTGAEADLEVVDCQYRPWSPHLIPLCMDTYMVAADNVGAALDHLAHVSLSVPSKEEWTSAWAVMAQDVQKRNGAQFYWPPVTLVARKQV